MATVPRYDGPQLQETILPNAQQSAAAANAIRAGSAAIAQGLGQAADVATDMFKQEKAKVDSAAVLEARRKLLEWEQSNYDDPNNPNALFSIKGRDSVTAADRLSGEYSRVRDGVLATLADDDQRQMFQPFAMQHEMALKNRQNDYVRRQVDEYTTSEYKAMVGLSLNTYANSAGIGDQKRMAAELDAGVVGIRTFGQAQGWAPEAVKVAEAEYVSKAHAGALQALITARKYDQVREYFDANEDDMQVEDRARFGEVVNRIRDDEEVDGFVSSLDGARAGFSPVITHVLRTEGGYAAQDGSSGAPVIYGLNAKHNPEEFAEARRITAEQGADAGRRYATEVYRRKYWNKINGDNLPPALQLTAMDAAVNQGVGNANKWIRESGGDVAKFNELRRAHYDRLKASGKYTDAEYRSWMSRLEGVAAPATSMGYSDKVRAIDADPLLSREQRRLAKAKVRELQELEEFDKNERAATVVEEINRHLVTGGTMTNLPPDLRLQAEQYAPKELRDFERTASNGGSAMQTDNVRYADLLQEYSEKPLAFMRRDLRRELPYLSSSDFQELSKMQANLKTGRSDNVAQQNKMVFSVVEPLMVAAGFKKKAGQGYEWVEGKREAGAPFYKELNGMINSYRAKYQKDPGFEDVQKWATSLLVQSAYNLDDGGFDWPDTDGRAFAFQLPPQFAAQLRKEGDFVVLSDGQKWKMVNGQIKRVK